MSWGRICAIAICIWAGFLSPELSTLQIPLLAPYEAYPSFANPPIRPYDTVALSAIVNLINPPHLLLKRVPAKLLQSPSNYENRTTWSLRSLTNLPHFDTPVFEDFQPAETQKTNNDSVKDNKPSENVLKLNQSIETPPIVFVPPSSSPPNNIYDSNVAKPSTIKLNTVPSFNQPNATLPLSRQLQILRSEAPKTNPGVSRHSEDESVKSTSNTEPHYKFQYSVSDLINKDVKSHSEVRNGDVVTGEYSVLEPDGYTRKVTYYADKESGFNAKVVRIAPLKNNLLE